MNPAEFDRLVAAAYARIPARFRGRLKNIALVVEPEPAPAQLAQCYILFPKPGIRQELWGRFAGVPSGSGGLVTRPNRL
jgi:predicted Zn-dependent protease with MMP-like domain